MDFDAISTKHKDAMRDRIMRGWPFTPEEREQILQYCAGDVKPLLQLLARVLPDIDLGVALYWGEFAAVSRRDAAQRRADRHGELPATRQQERLARDP